MRLFEINTWVWLSELRARYGRPVALGTVPAAEWDEIAAYRFDAVWLMGVWQRSAQGRAIARADAGVQAACRSMLPGCTPEDIVGSPYSVGRYVVDDWLGGPGGLKVARQELRRRGLGLVLDFVPNHSGRDHPWIDAHPEYYVHGRDADLRAQPDRYFRTPADTILAHGAPSKHGRDVWRDTAQLDAFSPGYRQAAVETLADLAEQCDGVRCDMAMLLCNGAFSAAWAPATTPPGEFWTEVIGRARERYPKLMFIAEAYSDSEWLLQRQGFDYCYDKDKLYERLAHGDAESVRQHLEHSDPAFLAHLIHFLENHDEPPVTECFQPPGRHQLAAVAVATLPGASLWYDRQFEGRWGRLPVQLGRQMSIRQFYRRLLVATDRSSIRRGDWAWCAVQPRSSSLLAWCWSNAEDRVLVVLNLSEAEAWGQLAVPWSDLRGKQWLLRDLLSGEQYGPRDGDDMHAGRLTVGRPPWGAHLCEVVRAD